MDGTWVETAEYAVAVCGEEDDPGRVDPRPERYGHWESKEFRFWAIDMGARHPIMFETHIYGQADNMAGFTCA